MNRASVTPIYRLMHIDNLATCLRRQGLHAPLHVPDDGLPYRTIHNVDIQRQRRVTQIPCGPRGTLQDYVPFYFGVHSPMLLQLNTNRVPGYTEGQKPLIYLVSTAEAIRMHEVDFVFSDGHAIARYTRWFDDLRFLRKVDWDVVAAQYWADTTDDPDRQRRKQAEFLVHRFCPWELVLKIGVFDDTIRRKVQDVLEEHEADAVVRVRRDWYY